MAIIEKLLQDVEIHTKMATEPNVEAGMSADEVKDKFDEPARILKRYINEVLVPALNGKTEAEGLENKISDEMAKSGVLGFRGVLTAADDLDAAVTAGIYIYNADSVPANAPFPYLSLVTVKTADWHGRVQVTQTVQRVGVNDEQQIAVRHRNATAESVTWLPWNFPVMTDTAVDGDDILTYRTASPADFGDLTAQLVKSGNYIITSDGWTDFPYAGGGALLVLRYSPNYAVQIAIDIHGSGICTRIVNLSTFEIYRDWASPTDGYPVYRPLADPEQYGNLLSRVVSDGFYVVTGGSGWEDLPTEGGGALLVFRYTENYAVQLLVSSRTGGILSRIVNRENCSVYRDWASPDGLQPMAVLAVGDSICRGYRNNEAGFVGGLGMPYLNAGVSGATLSNKVTAYTNIPDQLVGVAGFDPDVIIADGGVNDYYQSAPLGAVPNAPAKTEAEAEALDRSTVMGGLQYLLYTMIGLYPKARRFFLLTHKTTAAQYTGGPVVDWTVTPNGAGYTQTELFDAIRRTCALYNTNIIDVFNKSQINTAFGTYVSEAAWGDDASVSNTEWVDSDGIHPLAYGYKHGYLPIVRAALLSEGDSAGGAAQEGDSSACYYASLSAAVADINSGTTDNSVRRGDARVKVFTAHTGAVTVMLLDDIAETAQIDVTKNIDIALNGKNLAFTAPAAYLNFAAGTDCTIWGSGGGIYKEYTAAATAAANLVKTAGNLAMHGGVLSHIGNNSGGVLVVTATDTAELIMDGVTVHGENTSTATDAPMRTMQLKSPKVEVLRCNISAKGAGAVYAIFDLSTASNMEFADCTISADSSAGAVKGALIMGTARFDSCAVVTDAPSDSADRAHSVGIYNSGTVHLDNCTVYGTHSGVSNSGDLYVYGGRLSAHSHGGAYLSHGADRAAYINDAEIVCGEYAGRYDSAAFASGILASLYVSGSDTAAYFDGCAFGDAGMHLLVMRGTGGETNNTLNLSNCTIPKGTEKKIRVDAAGGHTLNIGIGGNITAANVDNSADTHTTGQLYRRKQGDSLCHGADFNAMLASQPLIGTTQEITPEQVYQAVLTGRDVALRHTEEGYGDMVFGGFSYAHAANNSVVASVVFALAGLLMCAQLIGSLYTSEWEFSVFIIPASAGQ